VDRGDDLRENYVSLSQQLHLLAPILDSGRLVHNDCNVGDENVAAVTNMIFADFVVTNFLEMLRAGTTISFYSYRYLLQVQEN
jgi:undecaprenyl pyrophosphate phosphatase UppP